MEWLKEWFLQRTSGTCGFVLLRAIWDGKRGWWWAKTSASLCFLVAGNFHRKASVIMVDELLSAYPHQLSFSEAGLRIMITSHFPPKTRLSMASRMLINEVCLFSCSPLFLYLSHSEFALACGSIQVKMDLWIFLDPCVHFSQFHPSDDVCTKSPLAICTRGDFGRESFKSLCGYAPCSSCSQQMPPALIWSDVNMAYFIRWYYTFWPLSSCIPAVSSTVTGPYLIKAVSVWCLSSSCKQLLHYAWPKSIPFCF